VRSIGYCEVGRTRQRVRPPLYLIPPVPVITIPSAVDPHSCGADRRSVRHVKRTLTPARTLAHRAVVCSACPGSMAGGMALRNHPRTATRRRSCRSRSRSAPAGGAVTATARPLRRAVRTRRALPYAAPVWRGPAGCRPTDITNSRCCRLPAALRLPLSAPADGRVAWPAWSASGATGRAPRRRRVRPASGRLEGVQKVLTTLAGSRWPGCRQLLAIATDRCAQTGTPTLRYRWALWRRDDLTVMRSGGRPRMSRRTSMSRRRRSPTTGSVARCPSRT
jgi:hypothetical protein